MLAVLGATGNVGRATCRALREADAPVHAIVRDAGKASELRQIGCEILAADLHESAALAEAIAGADAVQIIVPLSPQAPDPAQDMRRSSRSLMTALRRARPTRILLISDYGAHVDENIGMPSIFREVEAGLRQLDGHKLILRSAEHIHNWARNIPMALANGVLASFQNPVEVAQPMISAHDLGRIAADLLLNTAAGDAVRVIHAEGPRRYSAKDVAAALNKLSGKPVQARAVPRDQWNAILGQSMPPSLAEMLIRANDAKNKGGLVDVGPDSDAELQGRTELCEALQPFVAPR